jgi:NAD(P)-dependent dehydrogenase (short-subunit alcohol dehydrogenase family)
MQTVFSIANQP